MNRLMQKLKDNAKDLTLLYVEDEIESLQSITVFLRSFFYRIDTAQNGMEGLEKYKQMQESEGKGYDLVVTDLSMPHMDGVSFANELLKINPEQTIAVVSGQEDSQSLIELINIGINYFAKKPLDSRNLVGVLTKAAKAINNEKELQNKKQKLHQLNAQLKQEVKEQNLSLYHRLYYDELTKLPKRNKLIEDIQNLDPKGLMIINVDRFKDINSVYGHTVGDKVLIALSEELLQISLEKNCTLYNIGGDEFVLLNLHKDSGDQNHMCPQLAGEIIDRFEKYEITVSNEDETVDILVKLTIGMSQERSQLFKTAQLALAEAETKRQGFVLYSPKLELEKEPSQDMQTAKLIKHAIENDEVVVFYQPIIAGDTIKYECLVRILHKDKVISPALFLDLAKKIRYYDKITQIVIEKSCQTFTGSDTKFSINLTFEDIQNHSTLWHLFDAIDKYNVSGQLIVEIVESESLQDIKMVKSFVQSLKDKGVQVAIDDFGSGYSNFGYLIDLQPDYIKIDGSIIKTIDSDPASAVIAETIKEFSQKMGAKTIGEFIHSQSVYEKAKEIGIDAFQGYYFSKPLQTPDFA